MNHDCDHPTVKSLTDSAVREIEELTGAEVAFVVSFDKKGKPIPLKPGSVRQGEVSFPIKTSEIYSINSASFGSYAGSTCLYWVVDGKAYQFCY